MERNDERAVGFLIRSAAPEFRFFRLFEFVEGERGVPCKVARWSREPMTAKHFSSEREADRARDDWQLGPSAPGLGVVPASAPFGPASYRTFVDGERAS